MAAIKHHIILIGFMASGKSTLGQMLAQRINVDFYDLDAIIASAYNMSLKRIFTIKGEDYFRLIEVKMLKILLNAQPAIISLGGGTFIEPQARHLIFNRATTIWLRADFDILYKRLRNSRRPLILQNKKKYSILRKLNRERENIYRKADLHINSQQLIPEKIISNIIKELRFGNLVLSD